jgi:hypothetical protein
MAPALAPRLALPRVTVLIGIKSSSDNPQVPSAISYSLAWPCITYGLGGFSALSDPAGRGLVNWRRLYVLHHREHRGQLQRGNTQHRAGDAHRDAGDDHLPLPPADIVPLEILSHAAVAGRQVRAPVPPGLGPVAVHWSAAVRAWADWARVPRRAGFGGASAATGSGLTARSWASSSR